MNRLGRILTLGLEKKRAWQLPLLAVLLALWVAGFAVRNLRKWSQRPDSNRRPADYKSAALPLSYAGLGYPQSIGVFR